MTIFYQVMLYFNTSRVGVCLCQNDIISVSSCRQLTSLNAADNNMSSLDDINRMISRLKRLTLLSLFVSLTTYLHIFRSIRINNTLTNE